MIHKKYMVMIASVLFAQCCAQEAPQLSDEGEVPPRNKPARSEESSSNQSSENSLLRAHENDALAAQKPTILEAASRGDVNTVYDWLRGTIPSVLSQNKLLLLRDGNGDIALSWAAGKGHLDVVRLLLAERTYRPEVKDMLRSQNRNGVTPLLWAVQGGHAWIVDKLLDAMNRVNDFSMIFQSQYDTEETPLLVAARKGYTLIVEKLFTAADKKGKLKDLLLVKDIKGDTPLMKALRYGRYGVVELILKAAKKVEAVAKLIFEPDDTGTTTLMSAIISGDIKNVRLILSTAKQVTEEQKNPKKFTEFLNAQDLYGKKTALLWIARMTQGASQKGKWHYPESTMLVILKELLQHHPDIITTDNKGNTAIYWAAYLNFNLLLDEFKKYTDSQGLAELFDLEVKAARKRHEHEDSERRRAARRERRDLERSWGTPPTGGGPSSRERERDRDESSRIMRPSHPTGQFGSSSRNRRDERGEPSRGENRELFPPGWFK